MVTIYRLLIEGRECKSHGKEKVAQLLAEIANTAKLPIVESKIYDELENELIVQIIAMGGYVICYIWPLEENFFNLEMFSRKDFNKDKIKRACEIFFAPKYLITKKA